MLFFSKFCKDLTTIMSKYSSRAFWRKHEISRPKNKDELFKEAEEALVDANLSKDKQPKDNISEPTVSEKPTEPIELAKSTGLPPPPIKLGHRTSDYLSASRSALSMYGAFEAKDVSLPKELSYPTTWDEVEFDGKVTYKDFEPNNGKKYNKVNLLPPKGLPFSPSSPSHKEPDIKSASRSAPYENFSAGALFPAAPMDFGENTALSEKDFEDSKKKINVAEYFSQFNDDSKTVYPSN